MFKICKTVPLIVISTFGNLSISFDLFIENVRSSLLKDGLALMQESNIHIVYAKCSFMISTVLWPVKIITMLNERITRYDATFALKKLIK